MARTQLRVAGRACLAPEAAPRSATPPRGRHPSPSALVAASGSAHRSSATAAARSPAAGENSRPAGGPRAGAEPPPAPVRPLQGGRSCASTQRIAAMGGRKTRGHPSRPLA